MTDDSAIGSKYVCHGLKIFSFCIEIYFLRLSFGSDYIKLKLSKVKVKTILTVYNVNVYMKAFDQKSG